MKVLRYLKGTQSLGLKFTDGPGSLNLTAFSDSDWATDQGRSTSGVLLKLGGTAVHWSSNRQDVVAVSSTEAEYIAASEAAKDVHSCRVFLAEIGIAQAESTPLFIDNETAIRMAFEEGNVHRRRHIEVRHHYIRHQTQEGFIQPMWIPTKEQEADIFTKAVTPVSQFITLRDQVMGHSTSSYTASSSAAIHFAASS